MTNKQLKKAIHTVSFRLGKMEAAGAPKAQVEAVVAEINLLLEEAWVRAGGEKRNPSRRK